MLGDPIQNAAVTLSAPILLAFNAVNNLFGIGTSSLMSRALGKKAYDEVRRASAFGFYCTVFCSFLFSVIYLTVKSPLLVLLGTDADTVDCAACLYFFGLLFIKRKRTYVCINLRMFRLKKEIIAEVCKVWIPAAIQNLLNVVGMTVLNNFTSSFGANAVAAMGIAQKIDMVPVNVAFGFSQGIMPLISYNYASGDRKRMKETVVFAGKVTVFVLAAVASCFFAASGFWMELFIRNESIVAYGASFLKGLCIALPFLGMDFLAVGVFQAVGMGEKAFFFAILRKIIMEIPAIYLLNKIVLLYGMAYAQFVTEVVLAVAAVAVLRKMFLNSEHL